MTRKPKGQKYLGLHARGQVIYFEREMGMERVKFSTHTSDWNEAAATRDLYFKRKAEKAATVGEAPTFAVLAKRYLSEATAHLSGSTLEDRKRMLEPEGLLTAYFGTMQAAEVRRATLLEWWHREVEGQGRHERTGLTYLSALSGVFGHAVDLELLEANAAEALRGTLRRRRRSKRGRAAAEQAAHIRPLETPEELGAFVAASRAQYGKRFANGKAHRQAQAGHVADLLQLDAGLRLGEVAGLRWRDVVWGEGDDTKRALVIRETIARGRHEGPPKSGRERTVALSRRLRSLLRAFYIARGRPDSGARVLPGFHQHNYQTRHFEPVCTAVKLASRHTPKDLRDTYASQLLTAGIQLGYISVQLGHADVATTARHYARWTGDGAYRLPLMVEPGEVPADLLARMEIEPGAEVRGNADHQISHHLDLEAKTR